MRYKGRGEERVDATRCLEPATFNRHFAAIPAVRGDGGRRKPDKPLDRIPWQEVGAKYFAASTSRFSHRRRNRKPVKCTQPPLAPLTRPFTNKSPK